MEEWRRTIRTRETRLYFLVQARPSTHTHTTLLVRLLLLLLLLLLLQQLLSQRLVKKRLVTRQVKKMIFVDRVSTCTLSLPPSIPPSSLTHSLYRTHKLRPS